MKKTKKLNNFYEVITELKDLRFNIYRGMNNVNYDLLTSVNVTINKLCTKSSYPVLKSSSSNLLTDFNVLLSKEIEKALLIQGVILDYKNYNTVLDALAIAQQYGYPTRLLDWTIDWRIALYFAVQKAVSEEENDMVIYCLDKNKIPTIESVINDEEYFNKDVVSEMFVDNLALRLLRNLKSGIYLYENSNFERIKRQKGLFLLSGYSPYETFNEQIKKCDFFSEGKKIIIDKSLRSEIREFLNEQHITQEYLFPNEFAECKDKLKFFEPFHVW